MAEMDKPRAFIDREEGFYAVAQAFSDITGVIGEGLRGFAGFPSAKTVLQRLRQIPVIKRHERLYSVRHQFVEQAVIEIQTFRIWLARSFRKNPGPGNRKPIGPCAKRLHQLNVLLVAAIAVARPVGVAAVGDVAGDVRVTVPDRWTSPVLVDGTFDLIGRRRSPPDKPAGKF